MVLVDSTVWIDFFRGVECSQVRYLTRVLEKEKDICICGPILTEVLQGISNEQQYIKIKEFFDLLTFLPLTKDHFLLSSDIYRKVRKKGYSIRKTIDCIIASCAVHYNVSLLHNDEDFYTIEKYSKLKSIRINE